MILKQLYLVVYSSEHHEDLNNINELLSILQT